MIKKTLSILTLLGLLGTSSVYAKGPSLEKLAAKDCRSMAIQHALDVIGQDWGKDEVGLLHVDRSIPYGVDNDPDKGETAGYSDVSVVISRESADPIQYEMIVQATKKNRKSKTECKVIKEIQREML